MAQSNEEAEFVTAENQALWLRKLIKDLWFATNKCVVIHVKNQAPFAMSNNPVMCLRNIYLCAVIAS